MTEVTLAELDALGRQLWQTVPAGGVIWLSGDLGSGKTALVQSIARAAAADRARSPTFALVHRYSSPEGSLVHVDCYRLKAPADAEDLDLAALARASRLTMIEWPERAGRFAPPADRHVRLSHAAAADRRRVEVLP